MSNKSIENLRRESTLRIGSDVERVFVDTSGITGSEVTKLLMESNYRSVKLYPEDTNGNVSTLGPNYNAECARNLTLPEDTKIFGVVFENRRKSIVNG